MYESLSHPPIDRRRFARRFAGHFLVAAALIAGSLGGGMVGYVAFEHLPWRDAFLNAAMLLGGMGPVNAPQTAGGKIFAGLYALYAGVVFLVVAGVLLAPVLHRIIHRFHWESKQR